eukprot:TRINITY_DN23005_c0_g1_i1.p1 TRINITY_DN23005_c0_g1~~TRINITY_DN23005_c0_g1_i1.p1  ORF type:complete len:560 (-),score=136.81 TRINITY_DN23005_c0_g1_i1:141-1694(-)
MANSDAIAGGDFTCGACSEAFATAKDHRQHCKSERHLYNTKRKLANLKPITQEAWERKLRESRNAVAESKGTSHLKPGKEQKKSIPSNNSVSSSLPTSSPPSAQLRGIEGVAAEDATSQAVAEVVPEPLTVCHCLFDRKRFDSMEENLAYMQKSFGFEVPDKEYCTDLPGLLLFLLKKVSEPPYACIGCNRSYPDTASVRRHMIDKCHTHIGSEARTRRGHVDTVGTEELQAELEDFYDFFGSTREITERMKPHQRVGALFRYFDVDRDEYLNRDEVAALWATMADGAELTDDQWAGVCRISGAKSHEGLDEEMLAAVYEGGIANLDAHFAILQELLSKRKPKAKKEEAAKKEGEESEGEDEEDDESDDGSEGDTEVVECEDEDEFEEVMRVLGLQQVTMTPTGDLKLPSGIVATHRDVQHIYQQRGRRLDAQQLAEYKSAHSGSLHKRAQLMLSNAPAGCMVAVSKRQEAREGKRIVAVLKRKQGDEMRLGLQKNILQTNRKTKIRCGMGDHSGGR